MLHLKGASSKRGLIVKMPFIDKIISLVVVGGFLFFIGSKIYDHEKEHLDPIIKKIKGWFKQDEEDLYLSPHEEYEIGFHGQVR